MKNTDKVISGSLLIITLLLAGCQDNKVNKNPAVAQVQREVVLDTSKSGKKQDSISCFNDSKRFAATENRLLFRDSLGGLYLRRKNNVPKNPDRPLSKCQKLPYAFLNEIALTNDSILLIDDILDIESFKEYKNTGTFFYDKNRAYVFQEDPVSYPAFFEIELDKREALVIDSFYIKDRVKVYWQGIRLDAADPKSFACGTYRDSLGENLTLVYDKNNIYHFGEPYSVERLNSLPLYKKQLDSIRAIYFQ